MPRGPGHSRSVEAEFSSELAARNWAVSRMWAQDTGTACGHVIAETASPACYFGKSGWLGGTRPEPPIDEPAADCLSRRA